MTECLLKIRLWDEDIELNIKRCTYTNNGNLAIIAEDNQTGEPFGTLTTNTDCVLPNNMACVDTNNMPTILDELVKAGLATPTGEGINPGGFITYPIAIFDLDKIPEITM